MAAVCCCLAGRMGGWIAGWLAGWLGDARARAVAVGLQKTIMRGAQARAAVLLAVLGSASATWTSRVHIVDVHRPSRSGVPVDLLVRSNMPVNSSGSFQLEELIDDISRRAAALGLRVVDLYIRDISLNNDFDKHFSDEKKFWRDPKSASVGSFLNWPLGIAVARAAH